MGNCFHLAVAGGVYDGVFLYSLFFPQDVLDDILDLIESVSDGFPTYYCLPRNTVTLVSYIRNVVTLKFGYNISITETLLIVKKRYKPNGLLRWHRSKRCKFESHWNQIQFTIK